MNEVPWPDGAEVITVHAVWFRDRNGVLDPTIVEKPVLVTEAAAYVSKLRSNPHASVWLSNRRIYRQRMGV